MTLTTTGLSKQTAQARTMLSEWRALGVDVDAVLAERRCVCGYPQAMHAGAMNKGGVDDLCPRYRREPLHALVEKALIGRERTFRQDAHEYDWKTNQHARRARKPKAEGEWHVGPSDLSSCRKAIEYRERPPADYVPEPVDKQAAHMGTIVHEGFRRRRKALYPWRQFEVDVEVPGLDRPGRLDEYDEIVALLTDAKTAGKYKWEQVGKHGVPTGERQQAMVYAKALREQGKPVEHVEVIYINRENGDAESFVFPYDEDDALAGLTWLRQVLDVLDAGADLPRDRTGPSTDPICARYCPARRHCWNMTEAEVRGVSPEHATLVHDDPDVEWALEEYDKAREAASAAEKEKERMKALLEGAEYGRYGRLIYKKTGGKRGDPVVDLQARVEQLEWAYDLPPDQRPALADLQPPLRIPISPVSVSVKAERVAKQTKRAAAQAAVDAERVGSSEERQAAGLPGHCDRCVQYGHRVAHLDKGCADVGCDEPHGDEPTAA